MLRMFYFSGTGNARSVAHWMASAWREHDGQADVVDIAKLGSSAVHVGPDDTIGLSSPTHGFNFPPITLRFLFAFPRAVHANRVLIVNTRAGIRLCGLHLPGLSGVTQLLAALVFMLKGYRIVGMRPIDLPSNWISLHPGLRQDNVRAIYERCEVATRRLAARLLAGKHDLRALWDLPQDLVVAPLALGYYCIGRFLFAKSFIASSACDACSACVKRCPIQALRLVHGRPFWSYRCESCMRCMNQCPKRAIETAHGFVISVPYLFSVAMTAMVYPALRPFVPQFPARSSVRFVLEAALMLAVLFLCYRLLHRALRLHLVERLVVLTSLTHFGWWRRYRAPRDAKEAEPSSSPSLKREQ